MKAKGGVATVVCNYLRPFAVKAGEGKENDEYIITRLDHVVPPVNIVNIYTDSRRALLLRRKYSKSWMRLREDLEDIQSRGEAILILGDMNIHVGSDEWGVEGNHSKISYGGQLVREFIKDNNFIILNNMAEGGPWTWVQRGNDQVKSCIDLAIGSQNLLPFVKSILIDKNQKFTQGELLGEIINLHPCTQTTFPLK